MDMTVSSSPAPSRLTSRARTRKCKSPPNPAYPSLKWKPPSENSIDFKVELRFPPSPHDPSEPDFYAKPTFLLNTWLGGDAHEFYDEMDVEEEEWTRWVSPERSNLSLMAG